MRHTISQFNGMVPFTKITSILRLEGAWAKFVIRVKTILGVIVRMVRCLNGGKCSIVITFTNGGEDMLVQQNTSPFS